MNKKQIEPELNFKNLLSNPLRLFGLLYPVIIVLILAIGIFYVKSMDDISFNSMPAINYDSLRVEVDVTAKKGGLMPAVNLSTITDPSQELLDKGKEQYATLCASCHGDAGKGDGSAGLALNPKPRNFEDAAGWTNGRTFADMYKTLQEGIAQNGMAAYEYIAPEDRIAIIHFVRSLADFPDVSESEVSFLDGQYQLSAGIMVPNRIPVKTAMELVAETELDSKIQAVCDAIHSNSDKEAIKLLMSVMENRTKVITALLDGKILENKDEFIGLISNDPVQNGFSASILRLNNNEIDKLFSLLKSSVKNNNS